MTLKELISVKLPRFITVEKDGHIVDIVTLEPLESLERQNEKIGRLEQYKVIDIEADDSGLEYTVCEDGQE